MKKGKVLNLFEGNNAGQNNEEKYAILLDQFILPFTNDFTAFEYQEEIFLVVYGKRGRKERGKRGEKLKIYDVGIHIL